MSLTKSNITDVGRLWTEAQILSKWDEISPWSNYGFSLSSPFQGQLKDGKLVQIVGFSTRLYRTSMSRTPYSYDINSIYLQRITKTGKVQKGLFRLFIRGEPDKQTEELNKETMDAFWAAIKDHIVYHMIKKFMDRIALANAEDFWNRRHKIPRIVMDHLEYTTDFCKMMDEREWEREAQRAEAKQRRLETTAKIFAEEINDTIDRYAGRDPLLPPIQSPVEKLQDQYNKVVRLFNEILTAHKYEAIDFMMEEYLKEKAKLFSLSGGKAGLVGLKKELDNINFPDSSYYGLSKGRGFGNDFSVPTMYPQF